MKSEYAAFIARKAAFAVFRILSALNYVASKILMAEPADEENLPQQRLPVSIAFLSARKKGEFVDQESIVSR